jgi:hypothetical protein
MTDAILIDDDDADDVRHDGVPASADCIQVLGDVTDSSGSRDDTQADSDFASPKRRIKSADSSPAKHAPAPPKNSVAMQQAAPMKPAVVPRIFYATRTHNQLAQVIRELKRTSYTPAMVVLASRERYCINPAVRRRATRPNSVGLNGECFAELDAPLGCRFTKKRNIDLLVGDPVVPAARGQARRVGH